MSKKKVKTEERFRGFKKDQFMVECPVKGGEKQQYFIQPKTAKHNEIIVCVIYFAFLTKRLTPLVTPTMVKAVKKRFRGVQYNGMVGKPNSAFLLQVKGKAELSDNDTYNEALGKDVAYSKCLRQAYKTASDIAEIIGKELAAQAVKDSDIQDFLKLGLEREQNWIKTI